ncbi:MAG: AmmeMemoRadiSam system protein B [Tepidisphaera sp.]|nr:AmmeMemoRadiSam system protein B [Tepidisphaera sp.]
MPNPLPLHQLQPRLRAVRGFPAQTPDGAQIVGLADARQVTDKIVYASMGVQYVLPLMDGQHTLDQIVSEVGKGLTREMLEALVTQLDDAGLLFGPTFDAMQAKMRADFDSAPNLPPASSAAMAEALIKQSVQNGEPEPANQQEADARGSKMMHEVFEAWIAESKKNLLTTPTLTPPYKGIVAPHLDYQRGWLNYAGAWGRLQGTPRPDRVVILGTNHFGFSTGVCACDKGYQTPMGVCAADTGLIAALRKRLGEEASQKLFENRYDHEREHSIELQIPWIQHIFGTDGAEHPKVLGVLIHDPTVNAGESYDGQGLGLDPFVQALRGALQDVGGSTLVVSSADLSHVGPAFGDQQPMAGDDAQANEFRSKVFTHDREMLGMYANGKPDDMVAAMSWQQNPTRWCSIGNMVAAFKILEPARVEIINYAAAVDPQGHTMVSSASAVLA